MVINFENVGGKIGCFAKTEREKHYFELSFKDNNRDIVKSWSLDRMTLIDGTELTFLNTSFPDRLKGHRFDQCIFYNMMPTDLQDNIYSLLSKTLPDEFDAYKIMYYEDD